MAVIVVGAGISGLAAAYELARRGAEVVVLERGEVGGEQSFGLGRIFRVAHGQARLCALALEAAAGWRRWEAELGVGRLLGEEGLVVASPRDGMAEAMTDAGAQWREVDAREIAARIPFSAPPWERGLIDPAAGSLRIRRALAALAARVEVRRAEVASVGAGGAVALSDGTALRGDAVLICAGTRTPALAAAAGIELDAHFSHHVRLTYEAPAAAACLISPEGYGVPLGSTGRWALGLHDGDLEIVDADAFAAEVRERHERTVPALFPGLSKPVAEVRCVNVHAPWLDAGGDGWHAARNGRAIAFAGGNLMKFGPVLGDRLARTALGDEVHADLREPPGRSGPARFVVQLHDATTLHFDLRLELGGVLRSWAVPKGPSLDPAVRRLAVPVEDHSLAAGEFEGVHEGAARGTGAVIVWDEGTVEIDASDPDHLSFALHGHKLLGRFGLTRTGERSWILVKARDEHARPGSDVVGERPRSVRSDRTWQEVARTTTPPAPRPPRARPS